MIPFRTLLPTLLLASGCGPGGTAPPPASAPATIRVAAASDLERALPILAARFKLDTGVEIRTTLGASGTLAEQIRQGAPFDVFLSADRAFVENLEKDGDVVAGSVRPYALGALALVTRDGLPPLSSAADLERSDVKTFAIANPSFAPYGRAAKSALEKAGLWDRLESKRVLAPTVREALRFVESGDADAAFVGRAAVAGGRLKFVRIRPDAHEPIVQCLGLVAGRGPETERAARGFAEFLVGDVGRGMLRDLGFDAVPADTETHRRASDAH